MEETAGDGRLADVSLQELAWKWRIHQGFPMVFPWFSHGLPIEHEGFSTVENGPNISKKEFCHQDLGASRARESLTMTKDSDGWKMSFLLGCYIMV